MTAANNNLTSGEALGAVTMNANNNMIGASGAEDSAACLSDADSLGSFDNLQVAVRGVNIFCLSIILSSVILLELRIIAFA